MADILGDPLLGRTTVEYILTWQWRWGPIRARALLSRLGIPSTKLAGKLSIRQLKLLQERLEGPC